MSSLREKINQLTKNKKATRKWSRAVISLALVVALITTTVLINPAHATSDGDGATQTIGGETVSGNAEAAAASEGTAALADAEETAKEEAAAAGEQLLTYTGEDYAIEMTYGTDAGITDGSTLTAAEITDDVAKDAYLKEARSAIQADSDKKVEGRFFDLTIKDAWGQVYEPLAPVNVKITYTHKDPVADNRSDLQAVHITDAADKSAEITDPTMTDLTSTKVEVTNQTKDTTADTAEFTAESFSIYGVVYTVDFEYSVNGKMYQFSLPGGGFVSFTDLVEVLGIIGDTNSEENGDETGAVIAENAEENAANDVAEENSVNSDANTQLTLGDVEVSEATREFVADVASVEFSSPSLVDVSKVESETTVGQIKENRGLECEYSAELTKEQIAEINAQTVEAGDWALISVQPFTSEEQLTVTMKDGEVFKIRVTDAQIKKTVIDAKGDTWEITVTYGEDAQIPNGAELKVREILPEDEEYEQYYQQSLEKVGVVNTKAVAEASEEPDLVEETVEATEEVNDPIKTSDLEKEEQTATQTSDYARIFDIEIWADDHKVEPAADVTVSIKLLDAPGETEATPQVVHFAEDGAELMVLKEKAENSEDEGIQFVTDEFSVYSVVYTVDFETADGGSYSMFGKGEIKLSDLMSVLGIPEDIDNVTNASIELVEQNDENVDADELYIEKTDGDWLIKSDVAFGNVYSLTIKMNNGATYLVTITDDGVPESSDLSNFVTNVMISGATQNSDGQYEVEEGKEYAIKIFFAEGTDYQFKNDATLTYQMPSGIKVLTPQSGVAVMHIVYNNRTYDVDYHYSLSTDGRLEIEFDQTDPDYRKLTDSTNVSFNFTYNGQFDKNTTHLDFGSDVERDIVFKDPEPGQAYVTKTANFDENTGRFTYTITVTATGDVNNVNVKDVISGDALIFNNDVSVTGNSVNYIDNGAVNGFDYTFPSMQEGETITITYTANTDFSKDTDKDGTITADQTKNTVTVQPEGGEPHTSEYSRVIEFKKTDKKDGTIVDTEDGDKIIEWTIEYNSLALASAARDTITDTIGASSAAYMEYYGDGITVNVYDHSGHLVGTRNVDYEDLTAHSSTSWTYTIPNGDTTPYKYVITYKTKVDMDKVEDGGVPVTLNNVANNDGGSTVVTPSNMAEITKRVADQTEQYVEWESVITVPENGLSRAEVIDTFPAIWRKHVVPDAANDENIYEKYIADSLYIPEQDLLPGESYTLEVTDTNLKITFFKDSAKTQSGLQGTPGGHQIRIRLKTEVDPEWLQKNYDSPADNNSREHVNTISINGRQATATALFSKPSLDKKGPKNVQTWTDWSDGQKKYKFFRYEIWLKGVKNEPVTVTDSFDTSILKLVDPYVARGDHANLYEHMVLYGGDYTDQADKKPTPVLHTDTADGFSITIDELPKNDDGQFYQNYKIVYYLQLKDGVDLDQLAIANGGVYKLINTAQWGEFEKTFTYETKYKFLDKKLLNEGALGNTERTAQYQITFNPAKAMLNNGDIMEMTDTLSSNLSVDYSSIHIETDPAGLSVPYTLGGGEDGTTIATYKVPDATTVTITYNAFVRGNGYQTIVNKVKVKGEEDTVTNTKSYGTATEGQGAIPKLKIVKVDGYDANKKLAGVKFLVFAENPNLDFGPNTEPEPHAKEIILTTNENGEIVLDGTQYTYYLNQTVYHVREIEAPSNYGNLSFDYKVRMTNNMDEVHYAGADSVYYFTDTVQIKNWPLEGLVVEKQVESDDEADHDQYYTFKVSILDEEGNVDTEYNEKNGDDQFVNGVVEFELKDKEQKMFWGFKKGTKYKVEEIDSKGLATEVTYSVYGEDGSITDTITETGKAHSGTFTQEDEVIIFKNSKTQQTGSLKITKVVKVNGNNPDDNNKALTDGQYEFEIRKAGAETILHTVTITYQGGVITSAKVDGTAVESIPEYNYIEVTDLEPGDYTITEKTPTNGSVLSAAAGGKSVDSETKVVTVTVNAGESADAVSDEAKAEFTNNVELTKATIKKVWSGSSNLPSSLSATLVINGEASTDPAHTVTLNSGNGWEQSIDNLPKYKNGQKIEYSWLEGEMPEGFYLANEETTETETGGAAETRTTLTNTMSTYELTTSYVGKKTWVDQSDKYLTRPENLVVTLQRAVGDGEYEDLSLTPKWTKNNDEWIYTFENLPVFSENGEVYKYRAKETVPGGYTGEVEDQKDTEYSLGTITWENGRDRVTPNNQVIWTLDSLIDLSFVAIKPTANGPVAIWTSRTPLPSEKQALIDMIRGNALPGCSGRNIVFYVGTGDVHTPHGDVHVDFDKENLKVTLDFGLTEVWAQFLVGQFNKNGSSSYDIGKTDFKNTLETVNLSGTKTWKILGEAPSDPILTLTRTVTTTVDGEETTSPPEVVTVKEGDETVNLQPVWSGEGKTRTYTYSDLPKKDKNGNEYTYSVAEAKFTIGTGEDQVTYTVTKSVDGSYSVSADKQGAPQFIVTQDENNNIVNEETKEFEFTKIWKNIGNQSTTWPTGATITVTMNAYTDTSQKAIDDVQVTLSADGSASGVTPAWTATTSAEGTVTTFKVEGLQKYKDGKELHYYVIETQVDGYKAPSYATSEGNSLVFTVSDVPKATNGQQIINTPEGGYELPSTGGPGTRLFTILGSILILGAGVLLWRRRKLI